MKNKLTLLIVAFTFVSTFNIYSQGDDPNNTITNNNNTLSSSGYDEKNLVKEIMQIMVNSSSASTELRRFIAPSYCSINNLNKDLYKIDNYSPSDYSIQSYDNNSGYVVAQIWGTGRSWVHEVTFKIVKENGILYVYPEKHSESYIKPWYQVKTYIERENNTLSSSGYDEKRLVEEIMQVMVNSNSASSELKKFIAPSYYSTNNLNKESYKIDNYSPSNYSIQSYDNYTGYVIVQIWGTGRSWVHELTFKLVKESGNLYVYPEKHSSSYIKPWYEVKTYIEDESNKLSSSGYDEKQMVREIIQIMVDGNSANTKLRKYISPSYCSQNSINIESYLVDNYSPSGFEIKSYNSYSGFVIAHIWGKGKSWIQKLTFKMVKEAGKLYVYPEKHSDTYVKPWYKTEAYTETNISNDLSSSGYDEKQLVKEILEAMVAGNSTSTKLRSYISPSYCSQNNLDIDSYLVDNYSPVDFEIKSYNSYSGLIIANIWGKDKGWMHELTFKMVKENGKLYVYPEKHSDSYIKPWYKVRTGING